jgi:hypothetical protein
LATPSQVAIVIAANARTGSSAPHNSAIKPVNRSRDRPGRLGPYIRMHRLRISDFN